MAKKLNTYDDLYAGRFLKAGNFDGRAVTLTIKGMFREELEGDDGKKIKVILSFVETEMQLVTAKTNGFCIRSMFGDKLADWIGKRVTLFPSTWNGEPAIRVWGSPDIAADMQVSVQLPRRKPIPMTMHKVVLGQQQAQAPAQQPSSAPTPTPAQAAPSGAPATSAPADDLPL